MVFDKLIYDNGDIFEGEFIDGLENGHGEDVDLLG